RVIAAAALGYTFALPVRDALGYSPAWGAFALTTSSAAGAWIELALLRAWLARRIGGVPMPVRFSLGALGAALAAGAAAFGAAYLASPLAPYAALVAVPVFGAVYLGLMAAARVPELGAIRRILRRR